MAVAATLVIPAASAGAQVSTRPTSRLEVGLGLMLESPDLRRLARCRTVNAPCGSSRSLGDFGLAASAAFYPFESLGTAMELSLSGSTWNADNSGTMRRSDAIERALVGPRVRTRAFTWGAPNEYFRFWLQALGGVMNTTEAPARFVALAGGGFDGRVHDHVWARIQLDYIVARGAAYEASGPRASFAFYVTE